jgi:signal transduction histidine kinase/ActR/RegA family two-component response regulator
MSHNYAKKINVFLAKTNRKYGMWFREIPETLSFIFVLTLLFFIYWSTRTKGDDSIIANQHAEILSAEWQVTVEGRADAAETVDLPVYVPASAGEKVSIKTIIPDEVSDHDWFSMRVSHQDLKIYIDGELRKEVINRDTGIYRKEATSHYVLVELFDEDSGKEVVIDGFSQSDGRRYFSEIFFGDTATLVSNILRNDIWSFGFSLIFGIIGIMAAILGMAVRIASKNDIQLDHIGWALFLISLWDMTQSDFRDILFVNYKAASIVPPMAQLLFCVSLSMYFNSLTKKRYSVELGIYEFVCFTYLGVLVTLQALRISDMAEHVTGVMIFCYISFGIVFYICLKDKKKGYLKDYFGIAVGYGIVALLGIAQMIEFAVHRGNSNGMYLMSGVAILMLFAFVHSTSVFLKLNTEKRAALRVAESKSAFLANMSHEIRTPINAILGLNEAILRECKDENIINYATDVEQAGHLLVSLINDILDFSKLESGKMDLVISEYNLRHVLQNLYQMIKSRVGNKDLKIVFEVDENLPLKYIGDEVRIQQVIMNLLTNAVKYTESGKVGLNVSGQYTDGRFYLKFVVSDTGMGIREEDQAKLFDAFQRLDEERNKHIEGTGLGLAICTQFVKMMNGTISVESTYGSGSVFTVVIPETPVGSEKIERIKTEEREKGEERKDYFKAPDARILVVDDIKVNLKVAVSLLKKTEIQIDTAGSGDEALALIKENTYDAILLDHMMPVKDGIETFHELKAMKDNPNKKTPVIMLTANAVTGAKEEYMDEGFADYLSKPFSATEVQKILLKHLPKEKLILS